MLCFAGLAAASQWPQRPWITITTETTQRAKYLQQKMTTPSLAPILRSSQIASTASSKIHKLYRYLFTYTHFVCFTTVNKQHEECMQYYFQATTLIRFEHSINFQDFDPKTSRFQRDARGKSLLELWAITFLPDSQPPLIFVRFISCACALIEGDPLNLRMG